MSYYRPKPDARGPKSEPVLLKSLGAPNHTDLDDVSQPGSAGDGATIVAAAGQSKCPERVLAFGRGAAGDCVGAGPSPQTAFVWRGLRDRSRKNQPRSRAGLSAAWIRRPNVL
jgi:hypothetical protein